MRSSRQRDVSTAAVGRWEPSVTTQFLPGCPACGHKHPLVMKPVPLDVTHCPRGCGPMPPAGEPQTHAAQAGFWVRLANILAGIGRAIHRLAER